MRQDTEVMDIAKEMERNAAAMAIAVIFKRVFCAL